MSRKGYNEFRFMKSRSVNQIIPISCLSIGPLETKHDTYYKEDENNVFTSYL